MDDPKKDIAIPSITQDIITLIATAKNSAVSYVNSTLTMLYWQIGKRLVDEGLKDDRHQYGAKIVDKIAHDLIIEHGQAFNAKNLRRMMQFAEVYPDEQIVVSLIRQLSWTHFIALIPIKEPLSREFYAEMCRLERWSVRKLRKSIDYMLFERVDLSKMKEVMIR